MYRLCFLPGTFGLGYKSVSSASSSQFSTVHRLLQLTAAARPRIVAAGTAPATLTPPRLRRSLVRRPVESRSPEVYSCSPVHEHRTTLIDGHPLCTAPSSVLSLGELCLPLLFLLGQLS